MTARSRQALASADLVCCEDTRVTGKLLSALGIEKPLMRLDEEKMSQLIPVVLGRIAQGECIAYCSDAGMPGVSDPGQRLVHAARTEGLEVEVLPGPTACDTAYVASGVLSSKFYFGGFFPRKEQERIRCLSSLASLDAALIFYESPRRVVEALTVIAHVLPYRSVALCRELTKLHEEVLRGSASDLLEQIEKRPSSAPLKGEMVLVIDAAPEEEKQAQACSAQEQARSRAAELLAQGARKKDIVVALKKEFGISRNDAYALAMEE